MFGHALCFVPAVLTGLSRHSSRWLLFFLILDLGAILAQSSVFWLWPVTFLYSTHKYKYFQFFHCFRESHRSLRTKPSLWAFVPLWYLFRGGKTSSIHSPFLGQFGGLLHLLLGDPSQNIPNGENIFLSIFSDSANVDRRPTLSFPCGNVSSICFACFTFSVHGTNQSK